MGNVCSSLVRSFILIFHIGPSHQTTFRLHLVLMSQGNAMLSDLDIFRAAHFMMHEHGDDAELEAAISTDGCSGAATGKRCSPGSIRRAIVVMRQAPQGLPH